MGGAPRVLRQLHMPVFLFFLGLRAQGLGVGGAGGKCVAVVRCGGAEVRLCVTSRLWWGRGPARVSLAVSECSSAALAAVLGAAPSRGVHSEPLHTAV